nr:immunoglobulin light chain junction region [Macaca mulatta]
DYYCQSPDSSDDQVFF